MKTHTKLLALLLATTCFSFPAFAAKIVKTQGKKVLINLEGDPAQEGDLYYTLANDGRRVGILKIQKIKGNQAIAILGKGRAIPGTELEYRPPAGSESTQAAVDPVTPVKSSASTPTGNMFWGVMFGYSMDTMDVDLKDNAGTTRATANLTGSAFSVKGLFDYNVFDAVWFRGMAGLEGFKASGSNLCGNAPAFGQTCDADINYLAIDLWGRYLFLQKDIRPWVGAGFSLLFPMTKKASALNESSISNSSVMALGAGVDWFINPNFYIPISLEYGILPESDEVSASLIAFRIGLGLPF